MKLIEKFRHYSLWESVYGGVMLMHDSKPPSLVTTFKSYQNAIRWMHRRGYDTPPVKSK